MAPCFWGFWSPAAATDQASFIKADIEPAAGSEANINSLTAVIQRNPSDANGYNVRGTAYGRAGETREAIDDFNTAIKLNPSFYQAYANRALVQRRLGRDDLALADYNRALQINPNYDVALIGRGNLYRQSKQTNLALADFNQAIALRTSDPRAYHNRALHLPGIGAAAARHR